FNQVYEDLNDANNATTSAGTTAVSAEPLPLGVALETTLSAGQERLYQVSAPLDQTLRVTARAGDDRAANELYVRFGAAPTSAVFDAASSAGLAPQQVAVIPATQPGVYYVLVRGHTEPGPDTPVTVLAELLPLVITDVHTDHGGDGKFVTTTVEGARFSPGAIVKLVRPGIAEYEPVTYRVVNATKIIATFDLTAAPHRLYALSFINPAP